MAQFGALGGLAISFLALGAIVAWTMALERRRHGVLPKVLDEGSARGFSTRVAEPPAQNLRSEPLSRTLVQGPWPLAAGALGLAAVNIATLAIAGRPWGVTSAFALWGSKALALAGVDVTSWPYWSSPAQAAALRGSLLNDVTSVMNFGIIIGALAAAACAGRFSPKWKVPARSLAAAILGGLMLGYGARIAYGCNIGAYFSGVSSGSLHGWVWLVAAFLGNIGGTRLRPWFGLGVERSRIKSGL